MLQANHHESHCAVTQIAPDLSGERAGLPDFSTQHNDKACLHLDISRCDKVLDDTSLSKRINSFASSHGAHMYIRNTHSDFTHNMTTEAGVQRLHDVLETETLIYHRLQVARIGKICQGVQILVV